MEYLLEATDDGVSVTLNGRMTFNNQAQWRSLMADLTEAGPKRVVVDISAVDFMDSTGLGMLLKLRSSARKEGWDLTVRRARDGQVARLIDLSQFGDLLPFEEV
ncbi:STAS domain-containing protein [Yunchengibacter salinarum]|uniref:STAS domain-containing protein n=1 Tax=Yunchengibacter salinarum TaxID=3133399 RepID=UPI0035B69F10